MDLSVRFNFSFFTGVDLPLSNRCLTPRFKVVSVSLAVAFGSIFVCTFSRALESHGDCNDYQQLISFRSQAVGEHLFHIPQESHPVQLQQCGCEDIHPRGTSCGFRK